jgi:hypothetical protein
MNEAFGNPFVYCDNRIFCIITTRCTEQASCWIDACTIVPAYENMIDSLGGNLQSSKPEIFLHGCLGPPIQYIWYLWCTYYMFVRFSMYSYTLSMVSLVYT